MKNKFLKLLAIMGALWSVTPKAAGAEANENDIKTSANVALFANTEQVDDESTFGELTLAPEATIEKGDYKLGYSGMFYNWGYTDHTYGDWMTLKSRLQLENNDWELQLGRMMLRPDYASFLAVNLPTTLGNDIKSGGGARILTGTRLAHKETGLGVGLVANDTRMTPSHWDTGLLTYDKRFNDEWALAGHIGAGDKGLHNAGFTVAWTPSKKTTVVAEGLYAQKATYGVLGVQHSLTDDLALFAATKVSKPNQGKLQGWLTAGANYNLGKGFSAVAAFKQDIGGEHNPHGIIGIKYAGNFAINGQ